MKLLFSVFDSAAKFYSEPFTALTKGQALRNFVTAVNDKNTYLYQHPADYTLFELGTFDELTGLYVPHETPISLGKAIEFVETAKVNPDYKLSQEPVNSITGTREQVMC